MIVIWGEWKFVCTSQLVIILCFLVSVFINLLPVYLMPLYSLDIPVYQMPLNNSEIQEYMNEGGLCWSHLWNMQVSIIVTKISPSPFFSLDAGRISNNNDDICTVHMSTLYCT